MTVLVAVGLALLGCWCIGFAVREWRRREDETRADNAFFGGGGRVHGANWFRIRSNAAGFGIIGVALNARAGMPLPLPR